MPRNLGVCVRPEEFSYLDIIESIGIADSSTGRLSMDLNYLAADFDFYYSSM